MTTPITDGTGNKKFESEEAANMGKPGKSGASAPPGANYKGGNTGGGRGNKANAPKGRPTGQGGGDGTVGKAPKRGGDGGKKAPATSTVNESSSMVDDAGLQLRELKREWRRIGACFLCGSKSHKLVGCKLYDADRAKRNEAERARRSEKSKEDNAKPMVGKTGRGTKRGRSDVGPSGDTPPSKKPGTNQKTPDIKIAKKKFSYAEAAMGAKEMVFLTKEKNHIGRKEFQAIQDAVDDMYLEALKKGKEKPLDPEKWNYNSSFATVYLADDKAVEAVRTVVDKLGLEMMDIEDLKEIRRPTKMFTGLLTGAAARRDKTILEEYVKHEARMKNITGRMEIAGEMMCASGNKILRLKVDDIAEEGLSRCNYELSIGTSGKVKFTDVRDKSTKGGYAERARRAEELLKKIRDEKAKIAAREVELEEEISKAEEASIGSCGMSSLNVEDTAGEKMEADNLETVNEVVDESKKEEEMSV